jgi:isoleucyl-tRNA synthetase
MQRVSDNYRKLRNTLRFLLGNLHDFTPATDSIAFDAMQPLDQYILTRLSELNAKVRAAYDDFEFHRAYHALNEFTNTNLSALYLDVLKDRLYTFAPNHPGRRSAQTALWHIAETLTRLIAPILSFTADEVWTLLPKIETRESSVHLALFTNLADIVPNNVKQLEEDWDRLLTLRDEVLKVLEEARTAKTISNKASEVQVVLGWLHTIAEQPNPVFEKYASILPELFGVAQVEVINAIVTEGTAEKGAFYVQAQPAAGTKCERCWRFTIDVGEQPNYPTVCLRCADALEAISFSPYDAPFITPTEPQA